jgi:AcrR family transcriptional regulator
VDSLTSRGKRTRDALMTAARTVLVRDGFLDARITDISEEAGVAHGTFYTYFDSKEAILRELIGDMQQSMLGAEHEEDAGAADRPGERDILATIALANRRYFEAWREHVALMLIWEQAATFDEEMEALAYESKMDFVERTERSLRRLQAEGRVAPEIDPLYAAHALTGMVSRFAYAWLAQGGPFEMETAVEQITMLWCNAIKLDTRGRGKR